MSSPRDPCGRRSSQRRPMPRSSASSAPTRRSGDPPSRPSWHPRSCSWRRRGRHTSRAPFSRSRVARSSAEPLPRERAPTEVRIGLCGFTMAFEDYVREYRVVEVQQTFYEPPREGTMRRWRADAPDDFEFTIKAWQLVTHDASSPTYRRLRTPLSAADRADAGGFRMTPIVLQAWERSLACARLLRATAILLQCPSSFRPTDENVERMRMFFASLERPTGVRLLWEPRGAWPAALVEIGRASGRA